MQLAAIILIAMGIAMGWMALHQAIKGTVELCSLRNLFFLSFAVFQVTSGAIAIWAQRWGDYPLNHPGTTVWIYTALAAAFLAQFHLWYSWGPGVKKLAWMIPGEAAPPNTGSVLVFALVMLFVGILFKHVLIYIPVFGPLSDIMGGGLIALCAGLATWAWAPRLLNPVIAAYAGGILVVAMLATLVGSYGRRDFVAVILSGAWALYHSWWKHGGMRYAMTRFAAAGTAGAILLAAYTSVRSRDVVDSGATGIVRALAGADLKEGLYAIGHGQFAGNISLWLIENRPSPKQYDTLHSVRYGATLPVPRIIYPDKPVGLGFEIPDERKLRGKPAGFNVGPGIVGHVVNDNPWLALWLYPMIFGLAMRFCDEAVRSRYYSPFIILPVGAGLGELAGIARGEIGLFGFNATAAIVTAYFAMIATRVVLGWFGWRPVYDDGPDWFDEHNPIGHEHDEEIEWYGDENADAA